MVRHNHERYDGSGYPDGLRGDAIPFFSRILSILDSYEALVSDRVYRKGLNKEQALQEIERNAGAQFDPRLAKLFIKALRKQTQKEKSKTEVYNNEDNLDVKDAKKVFHS